MAEERHQLQVRELTLLAYFPKKYWILSVLRLDQVLLLSDSVFKYSSNDIMEVKQYGL